MKRFFLLSISLALIMLCSCNQTEPAQETESLKDAFDVKTQEVATAELGTVEYTVKKIIKADDSQGWYKIGDRQILFSCTAYIKAGIKMTAPISENAVIDEERKSAVITLPHAEVLSVNMPPENINLEYENVGCFRNNFSAKERNKLLEQGEADINASINELGIIEDAEKEATSFFKTLLSQIGFQSVTIKFE